jgi:hypothetical protein
VPKRLYQHLMTEIFPAAIRNDPQLVAAANAFKGAIEFRGEELHFTLPALFDFLIVQMPNWPEQEKAVRRRDYLRFRKIIYKNPTNETLGKQGAEVEIAYLHEDHELTVYRLVRKQDER